MGPGRVHPLVGCGHRTHRRQAVRIRRRWAKGGDCSRRAAQWSAPTQIQAYPLHFPVPNHALLSKGAGRSRVRVTWNLPLAKSRFSCYTRFILKIERPSERVKACATDLISTVRNCSGGPAVAGLCSAAEFRSLRHASPCFFVKNRVPAARLPSALPEADFILRRDASCSKSIICL